MSYSISQVINKYGVNASTLRYYEKKGLLPIIKKDDGGKRIYTDSDIEWLKIVVCMRKTGMSINYIKNYVDLCFLGNDTIKERYQIFLDQKRIIEEKMRELEENIRTVNYKIEFYEEAILNNKDTLNPYHNK
jgi:Predicted transcriptional regulators